MKMTIGLLVALLGISSASVARAQDPVLTQYFQALEGHWDGNGTLRQLDPANGDVATGYRVDLLVEHDGSGNWATLSDITSDAGRTFQNHVVFSVVGDQLYVSSAGAIQPVEIIDRSPLSLTYRIQRREPLTGRVYDMVYHQAIDGTGGFLSGENTVVMNGVLITEERFTLRRH